MATQVTLNSGSVDSAGSLALKTNGTTTAVTINASQGVEFNAGAVGTPSITTTGDTNTGIFFPAADTIAFSEGGAEAMRINSSGNVGIGTSSPLNKLQIKTQTNGNAAFANSTSVAGGVRISCYNDAGNASSPFELDASSLQFNIAVVEKMRLDSSGNLLVGTTSTGGKITASTASQTAIYANTTAGTNATIYSYVGYASSTATPALRCVKYDNNSTTSQVFVQFAINQDGANNGQINANGASTAAFGSYSDARLKENIVDLPPQLNNIMALRPVEFDYIGVEDGHQIGFIAQEMQQVYPDAVSVGNDEMLMITAWAKTEARLVKAIQEQQALITQLQADVAALKGASA